jgi:lysophospholipid acyltransferase (LPLAT)-like uncharacterized protein
MLPAAPMKRLLRHPLVQELLARLLGFYLAFALRTTRWRVEGLEHLEPFIAKPPVVVAFWHECLPLMPALWIRAQQLPGAGLGREHVLVSLHRDGRFVASVVRRFHVGAVLGSSSRGGASAMRGLLHLLAQDNLVGITPDGPRGPRRQAAAGVAQLAALSGVPVLPCAAQTSRRWVLATWDRMIIPLPFGRGVVVCNPPVAVPRKEWQQTLPAICASLTQAASRAHELSGQ